MNRQHQINAFTLAAHRMLIARLREQPVLAEEAWDVLNRWRRQAGAGQHVEPYWNEWERLLRAGVSELQRAVCVDTDDAATLRSVSPLGRFMSAAERRGLLRQTRGAA